MTVRKLRSLRVKESKLEKSLPKMNDLQFDMAKKDQMILTLSSQCKTLKLQYAKVLTDCEKMKKMLFKREGMISEAISRLDNLNRRDN